jgi:hypothetical protein
VVIDAAQFDRLLRVEFRGERVMGGRRPSSSPKAAVIARIEFLNMGLFLRTRA